MFKGGREIGSLIISTSSNQSSSSVCVSVVSFISRIGLERAVASVSFVCAKRAAAASFESLESLFPSSLSRFPEFAVDFCCYLGPSERTC